MAISHTVLEHHLTSLSTTMYQSCITLQDVAAHQIMRHVSKEAYEMRRDTPTMPHVYALRPAMPRPRRRTLNH